MAERLLRIAPFNVRLASPIPAVWRHVEAFYPGAAVADPDTFVDFDVELVPGRGLRRWMQPQVRFLLDADEVSSGRHPDSDIFLDDVTVSRRHAIFRRSGNGYVVQDVGSLNGTYVNGQITDSAPLQTGTEVQIGKFRLVYYGAAGS